MSVSTWCSVGPVHNTDIKWVPLHPKPLAYCLFVHQPVQASIKDNIKYLHHHWPFVKGIHWWQVDSPTKASTELIWNVFPCLDVIFNLFWLIVILRFSYDNALRYMPQDLSDDKSTLVQVMAWCYQASSHYLNQCWPRSMSPYGVTKPQWVNSSPLSAACMLQWIRSALVQIMAWRRIGDKPLSKPMLGNCQLDP